MWPARAPAPLASAGLPASRTPSRFSVEGLQLVDQLDEREPDDDSQAAQTAIAIRQASG